MKVDSIQITKEELAKKAHQWLTTQEFKIATNEGSIAFNPVNFCKDPFPVNLTASATLQGFINYLFNQASQNATLKLLVDGISKQEQKSEDKPTS